MNHAYGTEKTAKAYKEFLESEDGQIFQEVVGGAVLAQIQNPSQPPIILRGGDSTPPLDTRGGWGEFKILDAGCGNGWLAGLITSGNNSRIQEFHNLSVHACDAGEPFIASAKQKYPDVNFTVCDLNQPLPFAENYFDIITASMVLHDVENETAVLQNLAKILKPDGRIIATIVNPYYGFPVGEWKRGVWGRLLNKKPRLKLARFYNRLMAQNRPSFEWRPGLGSHFTPLSHHLQAAKNAGLVLSDLVDINSKADSSRYNLNYQLYRFPIILLLGFRKI